MTIGELRELVNSHSDKADDYELSNLIDSNKCITYKKFTEDTIGCALIVSGYKGTPDEIQKVIDTHELESLHSITSDEWDIIFRAIDHSMHEDDCEESYG